MHKDKEKKSGEEMTVKKWGQQIFNGGKQTGVY